MGAWDSIQRIGLCKADLSAFSLPVTFVGITVNEKTEYNAKRPRGKLLACTDRLGRPGR